MEHASNSNTNLVGVGATPRHLTQYIAGISAAMGAMSMGAVTGFASPASAELSSNCTSNETAWCSPIHITDEQTGMFVSTVSLGALIGGPVAGMLMNVIGRRGTMLFSLLPYLLGWSLLGFAQNFGMLVAGQFVAGAVRGYDVLGGSNLHC
ncbi:unnamed protein product [Meganyctiphanes norvegica]|uniref:Major facilitator superfamily (MFS) profile domain-containing protein n=1 Tax=Meganyctiphanes norvegica TaxID=48144 RepID=A0AAV2PZU6_MEGNR